MDKVFNVDFSRVFLVCMCVSMLSGCMSLTGYQKTYKVLSVSKNTLVQVATTAKDLHRQGLVSDVAIAKIRDAYERASASQSKLIEIQKLAIDAGAGGPTATQVSAITGVYLRAVTEFVELALEIGILQNGDERIKPIF